MIDITVTADTHAEDVVLGTHRYVFTYPKVAPLLSALTRAQRLPQDQAGTLMVDAQEKWLAAGFGPDQWAHIQARLGDAGDALDYRHLLYLFDALFREAADQRPPTLRGDSSTLSPPTPSPAAAPPTAASTLETSPLGLSVTY